MPVFSLPSEYGIGDFGFNAYRFVDFLQKSGQTVWQILPLVQTGYGDSPYSSVCSYSFNPYFISPEILYKKGLLTKSELEFSKRKNKYINYEEIHSVRYPLLEKAFLRFDVDNKEFKSFLKSKEMYDYALFMTLKYATGNKHFYHWQKEFLLRDEKALKKFYKEYEQKILFWQFVQFEAKNQWIALKQYANERNIKIMGDMPLYVALDSVDVWKNPNLFKLDENFNPKKVAGVPPDYFCADGQLWGNPVYDYEEHQKTNFSWWVNRIKTALSYFDYVRIDHFRGLDRYYEVESSATDAKVGDWIKVPSEELFLAIESEVGNDRIIAEDLGIIDDGVRELLKKTGYPGMKILSFAFNGDSSNLYLPEKLDYNCICYTGTHDNDTLLGLIKNVPEWDYNNLVNGVNNSLNLMQIDKDIIEQTQVAEAIIELGLKSQSKMFIMPMQDLLLLGSDYRINEPGTVSNLNWSIMFDECVFSEKNSNKLFELTKKYNRI